MITSHHIPSFSAKVRLAVSRSLCVVALVAAGCFATPAKAMIEPVPIASDPRVKTLAYAPDVVFKYTGYLRYQTSIEFAPDETVETITMGDPTGWKMNPMPGKLFLKPTDTDATTNMMLITNKRTYLFELHAEEAKDINDKRISFIVRFSYPDDEGVVSNLNSLDRVPDLDTEDLSKYNFRYTITGSEDVSPIRIFDDGEFTYFQFKDINADIPAFFQVDSSGHEGIVNYRTRGSYIIIERVSARYTLRHGNQVVCVFNEAWGQSKAPMSSTESSWWNFGSGKARNAVSNAGTNATGKVLR